ncbi:C40 family peptidase [Streptomyces harbinensis]|uniref:NlpC/P60 family protein n=1 Tax=Streptomyces harbinensis TaxID=1176198 RepID=A0A1I6WDA0_9ACTN|nr:C40 family peptidase [Streptomyces harbinensis]SFT23959.1 NlpC/P60 family protein [Streptomyces harbinensis]
MGAPIAAGLLATPAVRRLLTTGTAAVAGACILGLYVVATDSGAAGAGTDMAPISCPAEIDGTSLDAHQRDMAGIIIQTGREMGIPTRGLVIAIATALQESGLRNIDYGDRDSVGLFQQRPSMGWGTVEQIMDPAYSSSKFYAGLLQVAGWERMPLTEAAQAVQRSGFPDAYAKHEGHAVSIVAAAGESTAGCTPVHAAPDAATAAMLQVALEQVGKPYVWGGTGPDGFDCSGLIVYAWQQVGYRLSVRISQDMHAISTPVEPGQERPGDLLFSQFGEQAGVPGAAHVLVVVQPGLAVEAPRTGLDVRTRTYDIEAEGMTVGRLPASSLTSI